MFLGEEGLKTMFREAFKNIFLNLISLSIKWIVLKIW